MNLKFVLTDLCDFVTFFFFKIHKCLNLVKVVFGFFPCLGPGVWLGWLIPHPSGSAGPDQQGSGSCNLALPSRPNQTSAPGGS